VQDLLGHKDVATTQLYAHVMQKPGLWVRSPLDGQLSSPEFSSAAGRPVAV